MEWAKNKGIIMRIILENVIMRKVNRWKMEGRKKL